MARVSPKFKGQPTAYLFGSSLSTTFGSLYGLMFIGQFTFVDHTTSQAPRAEWCYQPLISPRGSIFSLEGYLVGTASYKGFALMRVRGRLLQTELEV